MRATPPYAVFTALLAIPAGGSAQPAVDLPGVEVARREDGSARAVRGRGAGMPAQAFFTFHAQTLGLGEGDEMVRVEGPREVGSRFARSLFRQVHRGLPVVGAKFVLLEGANGVVAGVGRLIPGLQVDLEASGLDAGMARSRALAAVHGAVAQGAPTGEASCEEVLAPRNPTWKRIAYRLAWRCEVRRPDPWPAAVVHVDLRYGGVLFLDVGLRPAWVDGAASGQTLYHGPRTFSAQHDDVAGDWRLRQAGLTPAWTRDTQGGVDFAAAVDILSPSSAFLEPAQGPGVTAHWGIETTLDYFRLQHQRDGYDGVGGEIAGFVGWGGAATAYHGNGVITFREGPPAEVPLDFVAHEVTHGVIETSSDLIFQAESGALNEAFANIFAMAAEVTTGVSTDWRVGDEMDPATANDIGFPKLQGWPSTYQGLHWVDPATFSVCNVANDMCEVHNNSGPGGRWFALLNWSGSGNLDDDPSQPIWEVTAIPLEQAAAIAYVALTDFLFPSADYPDARLATDQAADLLFGFFSQPYVSARQAWGAVGVGSIGPGEPLTVPAHGAVEVNPWVLDLEWEAGVFDEGEWQVQVATDPQLASVVVETTSQDVTADLLGGRLASVVLHPASTYYWRTRATAAGKEWWWEPRGFATDDMIPSLGTPNGLSHPWKLPFQLSVEPGTRWVDIQVSRDVSFSDLVFSTKSFPVEADGGDPDLQLELTLPMGEDLVWRARARFDEEGENASDWSVPQGFTTSIPKATPVQPVSGDHYPWSVEFTWDLPGAVEFDLAVESLPDPEFSWGATREGIGSPSLALDLPGTFWVDQIAYEWTVGAKGPPLGSELQPEAESEQAERSSPATFRVDGNDTLPQLVEPEWKSNAPTCVEPGAPVTFRWNSVANADEYLLRVVEMSCLLTSPATPCQPTDVVVHDARTTETEVTLSGGNAGPVSGPFSHGDHVGYAWGVRAYAGGGEVPGVEAGREEYFIWPDVPVPLTPVGGPFDRESPLAFSWQSAVAHGGDYVVTVYQEGGCSGYIQDSAVVQNGLAWTKQGGWKEGLSSYSWRVHPFVYTLCGGSGFALQWSECRDFHLGGQELPAPEVISLGKGTIGFMFVLFAVVEGADSYRIEVREGSAGGPLVLDDTFSAQYLQQHKLEVAEDLDAALEEPLPQPFLPGWWIAVIGGTQPVNHYFFRVQACSGGDCGEFSDWGEWLETIGLPF